MSPELGKFPFGLPNTERPALLPPAPRSMVVGVYPSAQHVTWTPPPRVQPTSERSVRFGALAVDVEPEVFWAGAAEPAEQRRILEAWAARPEGQPAGHAGDTRLRRPAANGRTP